jgi:hypothetical protein
LERQAIPAAGPVPNAVLIKLKFTWNRGSARDLNNILVTGAGTPKLLDFAIGRLLNPGAGALIRP